MQFKHLTFEHQEQSKKVIEVLKMYYSAEERLEFIGAIAEIDSVEGIRYPHYLFQIADHNTLFLKKGDGYSDIDGSIIGTREDDEFRVQTLVEYKYNTHNNQRTIDTFEKSSQFEHCKLLIERDETSTLKAILAVHSSDKLKFPLGGYDKDRAIVIKTYKKDVITHKIVATDEYVGKTVAEVKEIRKKENV